MPQQPIVYKFYRVFSFFFRPFHAFLSLAPAQAGLKAEIVDTSEIPFLAPYSARFCFAGFPAEDSFLLSFFNV